MWGVNSGGGVPVLNLLLVSLDDPWLRFFEKTKDKKEVSPLFIDIWLGFPLDIHLLNLEKSLTSAGRGKWL